MGRVVCFGEVLIRLSAPGSELLLQHAHLATSIGGAEANVAVSLARWDHEAAVVTALPDNPLGRGARDELRRHGVDTRGITFASGRMGLYFVNPGAVLRPPEVFYDRQRSVFALAEAEAVDWTQQLRGAAWLHVSGVTPALGATAAAAALRAVRAASAQGVKVSFDGNYRSKLWAVWDGDGPTLLRGLLEHADIAFIDDRDVALILGTKFAATDAAVRRNDAAAAAFAAFPKLQRIAATQRSQTAVEDHALSAEMFTRTAEHRSGPLDLQGVVDRIGAGDAFAAGVLHGLMTGQSDADALAFGLAAAGLKHGVPGDFNLVSVADVQAVLAGGQLDVKR